MSHKEPLFAPETPAGKALAEWWRDLESDRGGRAELRRARSPEDVALIPAAIHLLARLWSTPVAKHGGWQARIPTIAGLVAHLDHGSPQEVLGAPKRDRLPGLMAKEDGGRPRVSELRFRRLLRYSRDDLYRPMVRILALLDNRASLFDLADAIFWWGPQIKKEWAFAYFPRVKKST